jgi:hypothetical protein
MGYQRYYRMLLSGHCRVFAGITKMREDETSVSLLTAVNAQGKQESVKVS